ncbi:MAG: signal peptidase II [Candidatus Omnitrophica bacterium]|nr:signal peptidase II [Candidatus Omnitrophota bacterium]
MLNKQRSWVDIVIFLSTGSFVILIDRMTKVFFSDLLAPRESLPVIRNVFHFTLVHNTGIAFGMFRDNGFVYLVIPVIALGLLVYNLYYYHKLGELDRWYIAAVSLILGGAIGNLTDRILLGHVIDFIDLRVWPVFNFADSAITVGALIVFWRCLPLTGKKNSRKVAWM